MSRYRLIYQKPFHCAIACMAMIIYRHTGILIDQEEVGKRLGVCVPSNHRDIFRHDLEEACIPGSSEGISTLESGGMIQKELERYLPGVMVTRVTGDHPDFARIIHSAYQSSADVWLERTLYTPISKSPYIHDQLYDGMSDEDIFIIDPEPETLNHTTTSISDLLMSVDGSRGKITGALIIQVPHGNENQ